MATSLDETMSEGEFTKFVVRPLTTNEARRLGKVKVYERSATPSDMFRQSTCIYDDSAVTSIIEQHGMSSFGMECRATLHCSDDDPYIYVFVEALQLLNDWLSGSQHFTNLLQVSLWEQREYLAAVLQSSGEDLFEENHSTVSKKILDDILRYDYRPCHHANILVQDMLQSEVEAMAIQALQRGFEIIESRFSDHVLGARAAAGRDALKCLFLILSRVITDYRYLADILSTVLEMGHGNIIQNNLSKALVNRYRNRVNQATEDICQKLFNAAVMTGYCELVRILVQLPQLCRYINVNSVVDRRTGDSPLHLACRMGSTLIRQTFDGDLCWKAVHTVLFGNGNSRSEAGALSCRCLSTYYRFVVAAVGTNDSPGIGLNQWRLLAMSSEMEKLQLNVRFDEFVEVAGLLIRHGADINAKNNKGETPLHVASSLQLHGDVLLEIYALCRTYVYEQDIRWKRNCALLGTLQTLQEQNLGQNDRKVLFTCIACELFSSNTVQLLMPVVSTYFENVSSLVRTLLQFGSDINCRNSGNETALIAAAEEASRCSQFCRQLCTMADHQVHGRATDVAEFLRSNEFTVIRELLIQKADWRVGTANGINLLDIAVRSNQTRLLIELICQGAETVSWPAYLLTVFESENQKVITSTLFSLDSIGVDVDIGNEAGQTALHIAAERDMDNVVTKLIKVGAKVGAVDNAGRTPLEVALQHGCSNAAVAFQRQLSPSLSSRLVNMSNSVGRTALHIAAEEDNVDEVLKLLNSGADVGILDEDGRSPLVTALVYTSWNSARAILDHALDAPESSRLDVVIDGDGSTVLHHLSASNFATGSRAGLLPTPPDVLRRVLRGGISVNIRDFNGNTPLHAATQFPDISLTLLGLNADVNAQNGLGETPLHVAFRAGNVETVRFLMQYGADMNARDDFFNTVFHCDTSFYSRWKSLLPELSDSVVQSDTINVFGARTVFHSMALDDSRPRLEQIDTSFRDHLGNTFLHVAAGVYGHRFRSYRVMHFADDKQDELFASQNDPNLFTVNSFGQTPLHLKWLNSGFKLQRDDSLHQKDGRGRTSWHHLFLFDDVFHVMIYIYDDCKLTETDVEKELEVLRMFPEIPTGFQSKRCFLNVAGCNEADYVGRTPMHYAAMQTMRCYKCYMHGCYLYCKCCNFLFGIDAWIARDKWGRTPLHYAYLTGHELPEYHSNILPLELTDVESVQDIDGYTPKQLLDCYMQYNVEKRISAETKKSCFANLTKLLQHCITDEFSRECVDGARLDGQLQKLWPDKDETAFVWSIWTELQYAYRASEYDVVHMAVLDFMRRLVEAIGEEDTRLKGILHQVGSSFEGSRIGDPDEFDFNIELVNLNGICDVVTSFECPNGFAHLVKKPGVNLSDGMYDQFFDDSGTLVAAAVSFWFQSTWIKVLSWQKFWDAEPFFEVTNLSEMYRLPPNKLVKHIRLRFNRPVSGRILQYDIDVDIVPVVRVQDWWPNDTVPVSGDIRALGCNFVFDQPRRKHGATHSKKQFVRISFARAESMSIRSSPSVVRAAYMVGKQLLSRHLPDLPDVKVTSHTLKVAVLWSLQDTLGSEHDVESTEHTYDQVEPHQLQQQVEAVFRRLRQFCLQDYVPSFFMPPVHVPVWSFETFPKYSHTFLSRSYSNYEELFRSGVEPSRHVALHDFRKARRNIRSSLAYSYVLLYSVSSSCSWSTIWTFPPVSESV